MCVVFRLDPGLDRRFQGRMHLGDYTPLQLAKIAKLRARGFGKNFEDGLVEKLAQHISDFYYREIEQQNGGLSLNLTEEALRKQSESVRRAGGRASGWRKMIAVME